jgi:hypothetical protein
MVQIVEITEDLLRNVPHIIELLYELYGAKTIGLFAVLVDDKLGFIGRDGGDCVYIHDKGYNRFTLNEQEELGALEIDGYDVFFGEDVFFVSKDKKEYHIDLMPLAEPDQDDYDGCVSYKQYNPENDTLCEIRYQHMYNERYGRPTIYGYHTRKIDCLYIDEQYTKKGSPTKGILPSRSKYYTKVEFDEEMVGYKLTGIREYGLIEFLSKGPYELQMDSNLIRYARTAYIGSDGNYHDFWPLGEQLRVEELNELIKSYGFNTEPAWEIIEIYNGRSEIVDIIKRIVEEMKPISKVMKESQDTTKCALLTLKNQ